MHNQRLQRHARAKQTPQQHSPWLLRSWSQPLRPPHPLQSLGKCRNR